MTALLHDSSLTMPTLALDEIHHHPSNPRRNAVADEAMVESIRAQGINEPLMVAPAADGDGWVLIDGHRRWSGAGQAGLDRVPVNPRHDLVTEAQQIEVMIVTGLQKELLTPVEEASAYEQLALIGMDDAAIAAATGFGVRRVRERLKLSALTDEIRTGVHTGQITLVDVAALEEFADDPEATARLEGCIGTPEFTSNVHYERRQRSFTAEREAKILALVDLGARHIERGPGGYRFADDPDTEHTGMASLYNFTGDSSKPDAHTEDCLAYSLAAWAAASPEPWCTDPASHPDWRGHNIPDRAPTTPEPSEWEKGRAEREERRQREAAATAARTDWLVDHFAPLFPAKSHKTLGAALTAALPLLLTDEREVPEVAVLGQALEVEKSYEAIRAYARDLPALTTTRVLTSYAAYLAALVSEQLATDSAFLEDATDIHAHLALWDWIRSAGYQLSEIDVEIRTRLETKLTEVTTDEDGN